MIEVFLLLGSNMGNRRLLLQEAIHRISNQVGPVKKVSSVYETQSWGKTDEPDYLNQVISLDTDAAPADLLKKLLLIEHELGRERRERWGARVIDIDILFYGSQVIDTPELQIPHPRLHQRRFTLVPLAEIGANFVHPVNKKNILQLIYELEDNLIVRKL